MPKATKKKKEKAADFQKAKFKLGKGKKAADNATDTSFKARSIALPSQKQLTRALARGPEDAAAEAVAEPDITAIPTTASGLTIDDVLIQLRHVNAGVRRESVGHLKEVLVAGMNLGVKLGERHGEVAKVVRGIGGAVVDEDPSVRKVLREFVGWYLGRLPRHALSPYLSLLQLQIASALSSIFPAIRLDACKLVELLLETHAEDLVSTWPSGNVTGSSSSSNTGTQGSVVPQQGSSTIFEGLRLTAGLGEEKGASTNAGFRMTPASKLVILSAIRSFVAHALPAEKKVQVGPAKPVLGEFTLSDLNILPAGDQWSLNTVGAWGVDWAAQGPTGEAQGLGTDAGVYEEVSRTYLALHTLLLNTFMESAPLAFSPSGSFDQVSLDLCAVCVDMEEIFARTLLAHSDASKDVRSSVSEFVKRMTAWFPFTLRSAPTTTTTAFTAPSAANAASENSTKIFALSLTYAKLATLLAPTAPPLNLARRPGPGRAKDSGWRQRVRAVEAAWASLAAQKGKGKAAASAAADEAALRLAAEWIEDSLEPNQDALAPTLSASSYADLLPVIRTLIARPPLPPSHGEDMHVDSTHIGSAFMSAVLRQPASSGKRKASDAFLASLILAHEDRYSTEAFLLPPSADCREGITTWISILPRSLWELSARDPAATEVLLRFLLDIGRRTFEAPYSLVDAVSITGIAGKLVPFFYHTHPTRGGVEGPWTKLPTGTQKLALDVARVWAPRDESGRLERAVVSAVGGNEWAEAYWGRGR